MSAYATLQLAPATAGPRQRTVADPRSGDSPVDATALLDALIEQLAERVAERLASDAPLAVPGDEWLDSRYAAEYLGVHRDTLRKLAAERSIPSEQDGPHCKLFFRRSDLDEWRRGGGRPRHAMNALRRVA